MTGYRDTGRMKKVWGRMTQYFRRMRTQNLTGKTEQQAADMIVSTPLWRRKSIWVAGAAVIIIGAAITGWVKHQQHLQYIENNTFTFYHVYLDGQLVGTVDEPYSVDRLIADKETEIQLSNPGVNMELEIGEITFESDSAFMADPETAATLDKLADSFTSYAIGVEVKIDGKTVGVVRTQEEADAIMERVQSKFAPELVADKGVRSVTTLSFNAAEAEEQAEQADDALNEPGRVITEVSFVEDVAYGEVNVEPTQLDEAELVYQKIIEGSTKPTTYVVQKGDCVGCIAQKFDISRQVIYENNPWIEDDKIWIGDELDLTVQQPELTVRTVETLIEDEEIAAPTEYVKNDKMRVGQTKTIQAGTEGQQRLTYRIERQNGYVVSEELVNKEVLLEPIAAIVEKGTMVVAGEGTGRFIVPVKSYRITSKYGQRWGRLHKGIDLIGNKNIMAADTGVIEYAGSKQGFGKHIIIDHQNGYKTIYAHLSSYKVSKGDKVVKGDIIGIMGNTGNSTGTHLHFEVHKNGVVQNPLKYL